MGVLMLGADLLVRRADDEDLPLAQRRAWLSEAADCLADARTRPEPKYFHSRGQSIYQWQPRRFDPERLATVNATHQARLVGCLQHDIVNGHTVSAGQTLRRLAPTYDQLAAVLS